MNSSGHSQLNWNCACRFRTLIALAGLFCAHSSAQVTMTVGSNINITQSLGNNAEECIAINPANPANLFASEKYLLVGHDATDERGITSHSDAQMSSGPGEKPETEVAPPAKRFQKVLSVSR